MGDREGRPYKDNEADSSLSRIFVRATLAVALRMSNLWFLILGYLFAFHSVVRASRLEL